MMTRRTSRPMEDSSRALDAYEDVNEDWTYLFDLAQEDTILRPSTAGEIPLDEWMKYIPEELPLSMVSIPGTHNSCARLPVPWVQCQSDTLTEQLHMGIRYFDFRLGISFNVLRVYHGGSPLSVTFADAVKELYDFLKDHPSEAVMLQIKHEGTDRNDALFEDLMRREIDEHIRYWRLGTMIPTLGAIRGGIQLMRRYHLSNPYATLGIDVRRWADNSARFWIPVPPRPSHLMVQDEYRFTNVAKTFPELIQMKTEAIANLMNEAQFTDTDFSRHGWYLNWCNAFAEPFSLGVIATPKQIALGQEGETGVNEIVRGSIEKARSSGENIRVGTILLDFVDVRDPRVVQEVVLCNEFMDVPACWI
jgi:1-phosphatidylinositol phosphodiesterase